MARSGQKALLERLRKLDQERDALAQQAKEQLIARANEVIKELNKLGFNYRLASSSRTREARGGISPNKPCQICKFRTDPPHDARRHKAQGRDKKPFTQAQLRDFGYTRLD